MRFEPIPSGTLARIYPGSDFSLLKHVTFAVEERAFATVTLSSDTSSLCIRALRCQEKSLEVYDLSIFLQLLNQGHRPCLMQPAGGFNGRAYEVQTLDVNVRYHEDTPCPVFFCELPTSLLSSEMPCLVFTRRELLDEAVEEARVAPVYDHSACWEITSLFAL